MIQSNSLLKKILRKKFTINNSRLKSDYWKLNFSNPIGLAAGFDKNANVYHALATLGFGFIEVGTLTPHPQSGNPRPRIFRLPEDQGLINRMGFNNNGINKAKETMSHIDHPSIPIGINLGKNKTTPLEKASEDYCYGLRTLYPFGDYFVINISSPNTQKLRDLQQADFLQKLLVDIIAQKNSLTKETKKNKPVILKIAPDMSMNQLTNIVNISLILGIDGIIATNTTISRTGIYCTEAGGLSGKPLTKQSLKFIRIIYSITKGNIPIIGVGGVFTGQDAYDKIRAGANLIQVYTGMIYRGPSIARMINEELLTLLKQDGLASIKDAIGLDVN